MVLSINILNNYIHQMAA